MKSQLALRLLVIGTMTKLRVNTRFMTISSFRAIDLTPVLCSVFSQSYPKVNDQLENHKAMSLCIF